ncbi:hypothetical protein QQ045_024585 [Rhodiola kirilowii]
MLISLLFLLNSGAQGANLVRRLPGFPGELPFKLETGYVGVGGEHGKVQLYYYFVESQKDPEKDPLFLWLTGGPGCSGLSSMLYENGPFQFDYKAYNGSTLPLLKSNPYTFTQVANMIFLDAPVGTGFSYSETDEDYNIMDDIAAADANHQFLKKWLLDHPKFLNNSLYIGGDSYSGKIVPILVHAMHAGQKAGQVPKMNLQGYVLGNPLTDKVIDESAVVPFAHRLGFISDELYESAKVNCGGEYLYPDINSALCLKDQQAIKKCNELILPAHVLEPNCNFAPEVDALGRGGTLMDANVSINNVVEALQGKKPWCREFNYVLSYIWANDPGVQEALHVREGTKDYWRRCYRTLYAAPRFEVVESVVDYHRSFFNSNYRALIYSGDHGMLIPFLGTLNWISALNLTLTDPWRPWIVEGQAEGFTKTFKYEDAYELTFATVKGAGHTAPEYKPKPCLEMLDRWLARSKL